MKQPRNIRELFLNKHGELIKANEASKEIRAYQRIQSMKKEEEISENEIMTLNDKTVEQLKAMGAQTVGEFEMDPRF